MSDTVRINGEDRRLTAATIADLLREEVRDPTAKGVAVAVNGAVVPRRDWPARQLAAGDRIEIVKPFRGG